LLTILTDGKYHACYTLDLPEEFNIENWVQPFKPSS